ncbi:hypothetical protein D918_03864 [Trichuris suis]|nr:hypothetical protein D918_03864 [Trichuris suis]
MASRSPLEASHLLHAHGKCLLANVLMEQSKQRVPNYRFRYAIPCYVNEHFCPGPEISRPQVKANLRHFHKVKKFGLILNKLLIFDPYRMNACVHLVEETIREPLQQYQQVNKT